MKKRAQGLSINTIIIAAIALIVLVVLVAIFTGRLGMFTKGLNEATSCQQVCVAKGYTSGDTIQSGDDVSLVGARDSEGNQCYCTR